MFNFFSEIKEKYKNIKNRITPYQCIMLGNFLLYVEGFMSLMTYSEEVIVCKVNGGVITVNGKKLFIKEMSPSTITIEGKINQVDCL